MGGAAARGAKHELFPEADLATAPDELPRVPLQHEVEAHLFVDDGLVPNNGKLPLILYRHALALDHVAGKPERVFEALFRSNGWQGAWVDGIYDFHHYHSTAKCWASPKARPKFSWAVRKVSWSSSRRATQWRSRRASAIV